MVKYCPRCGAQVPDEARFCPRCGFDFSTIQQNPQQPMVPPPTPQLMGPQPTYYKSQTQSLIDTAAKVSRYIPSLTKYGKILLLLAIIFEALTTILVTSALLKFFSQIGAPAGTFAPVVLLMISAIFYLLTPIFSAFTPGISINRFSKFIGIFTFLLLGITYIIIARQYSSSCISLPSSVTFYGVTIYTSITPGIIILIGAILTLLATFINFGPLVNPIIQIIGIILIYAYTYGGNFNFESTLWGVAIAIGLIFGIIPSFYRGNQLPMIISLGNSIALIIFTIGMIITGVSQVSASSPPSGSCGLVSASYGVFIAAGALGIITGVLGILDAVFILIYTLAYKTAPNM
jgi:hypothetical protein